MLGSCPDHEQEDYNGKYARRLSKGQLKCRSFIVGKPTPGGRRSLSEEKGVRHPRSSRKL